MAVTVQHVIRELEKIEDQQSPITPEEVVAAYDRAVAEEESK